jgi:hypothetical protein
VDAVIDSSSLISLAKAGSLSLLGCAPFDVVVLDAVRAETVGAGLAAGLADAAAIATAIADLPVRQTASGTTPVDTVVLGAAVVAGTLIANDLALGRRARNLGARWLRTADLVVLLAKTDRITAPEARRAVLALADAGRITSDLAHDYLEDLG